MYIEQYPYPYFFTMEHSRVTTTVFVFMSGITVNFNSFKMCFQLLGGCRRYWRVEKVTHDSRVVVEKNN